MQNISVQTLYAKGVYIPEDVVQKYSNQTFADFDSKGLNDAIGDLYPGAKLESGYMSIGCWMRHEDPMRLHDELGDKWSDMFNIIQSTIRYFRSEEKVWY